jgi:hypothetical protein
MIAEPAVTPVTTPVPDTTVATPALPLVQVPPTVALFNTVVKPEHTFAFPVFAPRFTTVMPFETLQPVPNE